MRAWLGGGLSVHMWLSCFQAKTLYLPSNMLHCMDQQIRANVSLESLSCLQRFPAPAGFPCEPNFNVSADYIRHFILTSCFNKLFQCQCAPWCILWAVDFGLVCCFFFLLLACFPQRSWGISSRLCSVTLSKIFTSCHSSSLKTAAFLSQAAEAECKGSPSDMIEAARYYSLFKILGSANDHPLNEV